MTSEKTKTLVTAAFFVALDIIVTRFLGFEIPTPMGPIKFDFQAFCALLCGFALGPFWGSLTLVTSDLLGVILNGGSLGMFFGFTFSAFLRGLLFGTLLYKKEPKPPRLILTFIPVFLLIDWSLNTVWLSMLTGSPFFAFWISRLVPKLILLAVEIVPIVFLPALFKIVSNRQKFGVTNNKLKK